MRDDFEVSPGIFGTDEENYSERLPCVIIMDCSDSMSGQPIASLNAALKKFQQQIQAHEKARRSARIMLIRVGGYSATDGGIAVATPFVDPDNFVAPVEIAAGLTPLGGAVLMGLEYIEDEKKYLRAQSLSYKRPWLFVLSDGAPTDCAPHDSKDTYRKACDLARERERAKKVSIFPIAVDNGNVQQLQRLSARSVVPMNSVDFEEFFVWLSRSMEQVSGDTSDNPSMPSNRDWQKANL
jgi:uncharacterized protein YegL